MTGLALSLILVAVAVLIARLRGLGLERELVVATVRALVQMAVVAAAINVVFEHLGLSGMFLIVMLGAAAATSARRLSGVPGAVWVAAVAIGGASAVALAVLFAFGVFPIEPRYVVPIGGMLIGNCMTATSLAGSLLRDEVGSKRLDIEARLALGVRAVDALRPSTRRSIARAMIPTIDSTKNVGLIFLPGAFVGMIIGGASPASAARVQLIVLFMLLGAVAVAGMIATVLTARAFVAPGQRIRPPRTS